MHERLWLVPSYHPVGQMGPCVLNLKKLGHDPSQCFELPIFEDDTQATAQGMHSRMGAHVAHL